MVRHTILTLLFFVAIVSPVVASHELGHGGKVKVGFFSLEPISFPDENGEAQGFNPDLLKKIAELEDWQPIFIHGSWGEGIDRLEADEIDLMINVAYTEERAKNLDYNYEPSMQLWGQVFTTPDSDIKSITNLVGKKVAIQRRGINGRNFIKTTTDLGINCEIVTYENLVEVFEAVKAGEAVAGVSPQHYGLLNASKYGLVPSSIQFSPFPIYFAVKKGLHRRLLSQIDSYLIRWKEDKDSYYYQRLNYWMSTQGRDSIIPRWIWVSMAGIAGSTAFFLVLTLLFKSQVRKKTTEVVAANQKLLESEVHLKGLIDQSPIGLALCKMDGSLVTVNPAYADIIGYSIEETLQLTYWDVTPEKYAPQEQEQIGLLETTGHYGPYEKEYRHRDGHLVSVRLNGMILTRNNEKYIWSSVEDITTLKEKNRLEEQLRQSQKMEAIGSLAGGVAHDFNNILAAILGYTELVLRNPDTHPKNKKKLEQVLAAAKRAKELVKQILMFSRKGLEQREHVNISAIVDETAQLLRNTIPTTVALNLDVKTETATVLADSTQIHQVIMNLCTNAYHAMPAESGEITISLKQVSVDNMIAAEYPNLRQGEYALLSVSDTGVGMPPEVLARIFEPFYTTKKQGKGTGMGLAVVHGIIQSHDGAIGVESTLGKGTTFKVFLPLSGVAEDSDSAEENALCLKGTGHILFVDDEIMLAELGKETLESLGYRVTAITSGVDALARFSTKPNDFDLIITDQTMPEMTGDVFAKKALLVRSDIPIIICTGHSTLLDTDKAKTIGIKALLMKPVEGNDLALEVRKALGGALAVS